MYYLYINYTVFSKLYIYILVYIIYYTYIHVCLIYVHAYTTQLIWFGSDFDELTAHDVVVSNSRGIECTNYRCMHACVLV